ncbi:androgen-induced gene 1 protein-like isoform X2 [Hemicordylus capensis]|uniref:androgen-induced gene 1 protein-like isoform X2 n=1 Tax=Hemicordylus capensis TaxID=884348 RepID=UPI002303B2BF|nr:androgen-induced gene 1 protein-like isoform X2 [Hemicordylus capensis]
MALALRGQRAVSILHFLCFLWAVFAITQNMGVPKPVRKEQQYTYGGHWKHLTFLNQVFQTVLFLLCVITDVVALCLPSKEKMVSSVVVPLRDFIFATFVFPVGLFVVVAFWGIYAYDRELVYPKELDDINPSWLNHSMHTTILPLLFIELFICAHKYPQRRDGILGLTFFAIIYVSWIMWVHYAADIWAYPVLGVLSLHGKAVFISIAYSMLVIFYLLGEQLTKSLWAPRKLVNVLNWGLEALMSWIEATKLMSNLDKMQILEPFVIKPKMHSSVILQTPLRKQLSSYSMSVYASQMGSSQKHKKLLNKGKGNLESNG